MNLDQRIQEIVLSEFEKREKLEGSSETLFGLQLATVVDTLDPLKKGRVRYYTPFLDERETPVEGLPWASPISSFGGFDDSGSPWVPPAGSKVAILFHNGNRNSAYYIGTIWSSHRGADGDHLSFWDNYPIPEYTCLWDGRRGGYLVGDNTGDQVHMPWNTEMYNGYDNDSVVDFYNDPAQYQSITNPHIYGYKTNGKHGHKMVDGDPNCNNRYSRGELFTGRGNILLMKDDHLHPGGQYAFGNNLNLAYCRRPERMSASSTASAPGSGTLKENVCCDGETSESRCVPVSCSPKRCPKTGATTVDRESLFANPFYKRSEEMRLYEGAPTPQNNKCELKQSGNQLQSLSGHQFVQDDSVDQPMGIPNWENGFNFGCTDLFKGKTFVRSATGHIIKADDEESRPNVRSENNGISLRTASGNFFDLNDETLPDGECSGERAGPMSGLTAITRSSHVFRMSDHGIKQKSPDRKEGGEPKTAEDGYEGYILLRSGYGLQLLMKDQGRQDKTDEQFIHLMAPQKDNTTRGPHHFVMQEKDDGPGLVMLRAGGHYYQSSYDDSIEVVGTEDNKASKFTTITGSQLVDIKDYYFNHNETTIYWAENYIFLLAGQDCDVPDDSTASDSLSNQSEEIASASASPGTDAGKKKKGPCVYSVITSKDPWVCPLFGQVHYGVGNGLDSRSERVFVSAGKPTEE